MKKLVGFVMSIAMLFCLNLNLCNASSQRDTTESYASRRDSESLDRKPNRSERRRQNKATRRDNKKFAKRAASDWRNGSKQ